MGYRIEYGSSGDLRKPLKSKRPYSAIAAAACVLALVAGAITVKQTGLTWVQEFLLPGDPAVTAAALENMVDNIKDGDSIAEAVTAFCREIVENAE